MPPSPSATGIVCARSPRRRSSPPAEVRRRTVHFASIEAPVSAERACTWALGRLFDEDQFSRLLSAPEESLLPFVAAEGAVAFTMPTPVLVAERTSGG